MRLFRGEDHMSPPDSDLKSALRRVSPDLRPICDLELSLGNQLAYVSEPAGTTCPLALGFEKPLHFRDRVANDPAAYDHSLALRRHPLRFARRIRVRQDAALRGGSHPGPIDRVQT